MAVYFYYIFFFGALGKGIDTQEYGICNLHSILHRYVIIEGYII